MKFDEIPKFDLIYSNANANLGVMGFHPHNISIDCLLKMIKNKIPFNIVGNIDAKPNPCWFNKVISNIKSGLKEYAIRDFPYTINEKYLTSFSANAFVDEENRKLTIKPL